MIDWVMSLEFKEICDLLLVIGGLSAFVLYFVKKKEEKKMAATLIVGQIDSIDKQISLLREEGGINDVKIFKTKPILKENMWEKYRHLFVKELCGSEQELIQIYFEHVEQLEKTRVDIVNNIYAAWENKSTVEHQIVGEAMYQSIQNGNSLEKLELFRQRFRSYELLFLPTIAFDSFVGGINNFYMLSGTTAYMKLHKKSYLK